MRQVTACTQNEFTKIFAQRKYQIVPIIAIIAAITGAFFNKSVISLSLSNYPYTVLSVSCSLLLPLCAFMTASDILAGESERGELKISFTYPVSRVAVLLGKLLAIALYASGILIGTVCASLIGSIVHSGMFSVNMRFIVALILTVLPVVMVCSFALLVSNLVKSSTACFISCILLYIGVSAVGLYVSGISLIIPTSYLSIFSMVIGSNVPWKSLILGILVLVGYSSAFVSANILMFSYKEV